MTAQEQVSKLEAILARVSGRRHAPRGLEEAGEPTSSVSPVTARSAADDSSITAPPPAIAAARPAPAKTQAPATAPAKAPAPAVALEAKSSVEAKAPVTQPPVTEPPVTQPPSVEADVEVEEGMAEVDLDGIDEEGPAAAALSDSVADLDTVAGSDDLPASSRRPVHLSHGSKDELSFADAAEAKASHPVPPESGRQVATPASESDLSGVRSVPHTVARVPAAALQADVTRPTLDAAPPATFTGELPAFAPKTFGELLKASLDL